MTPLVLNAWFALLLALVHLQARVQTQLEVRALARRYQLQVMRRRVPPPPVHVRWRRKPGAVTPPQESHAAQSPSPLQAVTVPPPAQDLEVQERDVLASRLAGGIRAAVQRNRSSAPQP